MLQLLNLLMKSARMSWSLLLKHRFHPFVKDAKFLNYRIAGMCRAPLNLVVQCLCRIEALVSFQNFHFVHYVKKEQQTKMFYFIFYEWGKNKQCLWLWSDLCWLLVFEKGIFTFQDCLCRLKIALTNWLLASNKQMYFCFKYVCICAYYECFFVTDHN